MQRNSHAYFTDNRSPDAGNRWTFQIKAKDIWIDQGIHAPDPTFNCEM